MDWRWHAFLCLSWLVTILSLFLFLLAFLLRPGYLWLAKEKNKKDDVVVLGEGRRLEDGLGNVRARPGGGDVSFRSPWRATVCQTPAAWHCSLCLVSGPILRLRETRICLCSTWLDGLSGLCQHR